MEEEVEIPLGEFVKILKRTRRIKKSELYPIGVEFAVMGIVNEREVIRIDNLPHQGKPGAHIHFFDKRKNKEFVEYANDIKSPEQAKKYVDDYLKARYPMFTR